MLMRKVQLSSPVQPQERPVDRPYRRGILVTGGAGYLGSVLVRRLLARDFHVRVLDCLLFGDQSLVDVRSHPNFDLIKGDIRDPDILARATEGCDTVIHLAAIVGDPACEANRSMATDVNCVATERLLASCSSAGVRRFLFASTCSVYGASEAIADETAPLHPVSHYAATKVHAEHTVLRAAAPALATTVLRLGTLFGLSPRPRSDLVVNLLTLQAARQGRIVIFNGEQWRPFVHVADAARAFELAMNAAPSLLSGEIFNVGDDRLNLRLFDLSAKITTMIPSLIAERSDNNDRRSYRPSFRKISTKLGFAAIYSVEYGIRELLQSAPSTDLRDIATIPDAAAPSIRQLAL